MTDALDNTITVLERLVSFDSISGKPTHGIVGYIQDYLSGQGIESTLSYDEAGERANVFATIGPEIDGGVVLNGHTDVVPVEGQKWTSDPFTLTRNGQQAAWPRLGGHEGLSGLRPRLRAGVQGGRSVQAHPYCLLL